LRKEIGAADLLGFCLEQVDERAANELALFFGVGDAFQASKECFLGVDCDERNVVMATEQRDDLFGFIKPHQAMIDIDAG